LIVEIELQLNARRQKLERHFFIKGIKRAISGGKRHFFAQKSVFFAEKAQPFSANLTDRITTAIVSWMLSRESGGCFAIGT